MPRRLQRERRTRQAVGVAVIVAGGKPLRQHAKIGGSVAAATAALVHRRDRAQQLRDRRPCTAAQQLGLRRFVAAGQEPATQAFPALAPRIPALPRLVRTFAGIARRGIARLAFGDLTQHRIDRRRQFVQGPGDGVGATDQVAHEALQVLDQAPLVGHQRGGIGLLQLQAARHAGHEGLGIAGQVLEHAHQVAQDLVRLGHVRGGAGRCLVDQPAQRLQAAVDILQSHGLQLGPMAQVAPEHLQPRFHRLATTRQPIQEARTVVVAEGGHARHVRMRLQVAPGRQLRQRSGHLFLRRWRTAPVGLGQHFIRTQLQPVLALGGGEHGHDRAIEHRLVGGDVAEQIQ